MLATSCSTQTKTDTDSIYGPDATISDIENEERAIETARLIGRFVGQESDGLIFVSFVKIPSHGISSASGNEHYGMHYSMNILKRSDALTDEDEEKAHELAGRIFQLTTEYILKENHDISHMGVQIVNPDAWFWTGTDAHLYIAPRGELIDVDQDLPHAEWFNIASDTPITMLTESQLQNLLRELEK